MIDEQVDFMVKINDRSWTVQAYVCSNLPVPLILGNTFIMKHGWQLDGYRRAIFVKNRYLAPAIPFFKKPSPTAAILMPLEHNRELHDSMSKLASIAQAVTDVKWS